MRILCVASSFGVGGAEKLVVDLLNGLDRSRFEPALVVLHDGEMTRSLRPDVRVACGLYEWAGDPRGVRRLIGLMRSFRPQVVDVIGRDDAALWGRLAARLCRVPVVVHSDHHGAYHPAQEPKCFAYHLANRPLDRWTRSFVEVSNAQRSFHEGLGLPSNRMTLIYSGVDASRYATDGAARGRARRILGLDEDAQVVGCVASLTANKNHDMLLRAVRLVMVNHPRIKCVVVGDGPERRAIDRKVADMGLEKVVLMLGQRRDIPTILPAIDVLAVVSKSESFSLVAAEAMACGKPVLATDSGGPREIVIHDETGFLVPSGDVDSLSARLRQLFDDEGLATRMGNAGRQRVLSHFSLASMIRKRQEFYEALAAVKQ